MTPGTKVYEGMVVGEHSREHDLEVNVCKKKTPNQYAIQHGRGRPSPGRTQVYLPKEISVFSFNYLLPTACTLLT